MNWMMVRRLVRKDWYLIRLQIGACFAAGIVAVATLAMHSAASLYFGTILLITVMIAAGIMLPLTTIVQERSEQTLPFVMTMPITPREYTMSKVIGNVAVFCVPWLVLSAGALTVLATGGPKMRALLPLGSAVLGELLTSFVLLLAVAIVSESQLWTVSTMVASNLFLQVFMYYVARIPGIAHGLSAASGAEWTPAAFMVLAVEGVTMAALLGLAFVLQRRKRDFL